MQVEPVKETPTLSRVESFEIDKEKPLNNELASEKTEKNASVVVIPDHQHEPVKYLSLSQVGIHVTLIKNITGAGILCTPYAIKNMGIVATIIVYVLLVIGNVWCSQLLIQVTQYCRKNPSKYHPKEIGNDYAVIMYHIFGPTGYITFVILYLIAIWGVQIATLISIVDFICKLPWTGGFFEDADMKRLFFHVISTSICLLLVLMHDLKPIVAVASLSIFALVISFVLLLIYGFSHYGITFDSAFWKPVSMTSLMSSIGIPSFSLGYNFSFLSFYKQLSSQSKEKSSKVTANTISLTSVAMVVLPMLALFSYSGKEGGISQNILLMIPSNEIIAITVNVMMFLSCLFTYPIYSPPLNEVLEASVKTPKTTGIFVSDSKRLLLRLAQTVGISLVAYFLPNFGDIVSLVGGFVFTAISLVIPPILHMMCFKKSGQRALDIIACIVFTVFMVVSTIFSGIVLFQNMKLLVCSNT